MSTPGSERQDNYRSKHPQMNITFRDMDEDWTVRRALRRTGRTPREVLLNWAQRALAEPLPSAGKPDANNSVDNNKVAGMI
jgi:hypothetical protein